MSYFLPGSFHLREFIQGALTEDAHPRDLTTDLIVPKDSTSRGTALINEQGVLSGIEIFFAVFRELDPHVETHANFTDGHRVEKGMALGRIECGTRALLTGERTALNILQRMCGIATVTARFVEKTAGTKVRILDTRKTVPGLRGLDKYAVRCGGGVNHRFGLFDGILIKDNHIKAAGSLSEAVRRVRDRGGARSLPVEVETTTMNEVQEALDAGADIIMLDNMSVEGVRTCVKEIGDRADVEVSGGIHLRNIRDYALAGPDYISVGALTHSTPALDISLEIL